MGLFSCFGGAPESRKSPAPLRWETDEQRPQPQNFKTPASLMNHVPSRVDTPEMAPKAFAAPTTVPQTEMHYDADGVTVVTANPLAFSYQQPDLGQHQNFDKAIQPAAPPHAQPSPPSFESPALAPATHQNFDMAIQPAAPPPAQSPSPFVKSLPPTQVSQAPPPTPEDSINGPSEADDIDDDGWMPVLLEVNALLAAAGQPPIDAVERAVAMKTLIIMTSSRGVQFAMGSAVNDVMKYRKREARLLAASKA